MKRNFPLKNLFLLVALIILMPSAIASNWGIVATDAPSAWKVTKGTEDVVVAVIDTGIDVNHPALKDRLWVNPNPGTYKESGYKVKNDIHGWNFAENNNDIADTHGHGTHVAGIIAARFDGTVGGVAPNVKIMSLKYYSKKASGADNLRATIRAIRYAVQMGAHIINYSAGGAQYSQPEFEAIKAAEEKGILFIAAAGNEGVDAQRTKFYPASYPLKNIIAVASLDVRGELLRSSNYGSSVVHVAAPGGRIQSTLPQGRFGYLSGTSQAAPFVTGTAALILSIAHSLTPEDVKKIIVDHAKPIESLTNKVAARGVVNTHQAVVQTTHIQYEILKNFYSRSFREPRVIRHQTEFQSL